MKYRVQIPVSSQTLSLYIKRWSILTAQAVVTGAYFASFLVCLRWHFFSDDGGTLRKGINWLLLIIAVILFAFIDLVLFLQITLLVSENRGTGNFLTVALVIVRTSTL